MEQKHHYSGLSEAEVLESRAKNGVNVLTPPEKEPLWKKFLNKFSDPLIIILLIAGALSVGISCYEFWGLHTDEGVGVFFEPLGIFVAILLATGMAFIFELKADREFAILNQVNDDEPVEVIRNGNTTSVPRKDVVVGDIVVLTTGEEVPADGELLEAVTLKIDESTLTGEPICTKSINPEEFDKNSTFPTNHAMKGTKVMEGHGVMRVFAVGDHTENGKVFEAAQIDNSVKTPLNEQLDGLGNLITKGSYVFAALVIVGRLLKYFNFAPLSFLLVLPTALFFYLLLAKFPKYTKQLCYEILLAFFVIFIASVILINNYVFDHANLSGLLQSTLDTLMIAVTLIVVAVPEGLPMAVTLSLAYSMRRMLKTNNLVRKMHACETMGAATVICTDKTGTLTQNQMRIHETDFVGVEQNAELKQLIEEGIAVNSTATLDLSDEKFPKVLGNPTEGAMILWMRDNGVDYEVLRDDAEKIEEIPFTTEKKYMATLVKSSVNGHRILYVKGAPEIVMGLCKNTAESVKDKMKQDLLKYQRQAMRTLGFAYQILGDQEDGIDDNGQISADNLQFMGIVAISDPVRKEVPDAVRECLNAGIQVKIVTGDTPETAKEIGRQVGLWNDNEDGDKNLITGPDVAALTDEQLQDKVEDIKIVSRARPLDKQRLVKALQTRNEVVAVTGDGTNDAPALKAAHVGLSMGDGTSVAKEASDITIIDNSFSSIGRAVMWGRSLYQNIQRFILFQMTVNVAACFIVLFGAFMGTESPLTVTQMLWVNLIMDTFAAMALASLPPSEKVMTAKPRDRKAFIINKMMGWNIVGVGGIFFLLLLALLYVFEHADIKTLTDLCNVKLGANNGLNSHELSLFFTIFVMLQFWNMFNARAFESGASAFNLKDCSGFGMIAAVIIVGQVFIVSFGGEMFNVTHLKLVDWVIIIASTSLVLWIGEIARLFSKKN